MLQDEKNSIVFENATFYLSDQIYIVHVPNYIVVEYKNDETYKIPENIQSSFDKNKLALSRLGIFLRIF